MERVQIEIGIGKREEKYTEKDRQRKTKSRHRE